MLPWFCKILVLIQYINCPLIQVTLALYNNYFDQTVETVWQQLNRQYLQHSNKHIIINQAMVDCGACDSVMLCSPNFQMNQGDSKILNLNYRASEFGSDVQSI